MFNRTKSDAPTVYFSMPRYNGLVNYDSVMAMFAQASMRGINSIFGASQSSLVPLTFNMAWCDALNRRDAGQRIDYFVMLHSDIHPQPGFFDILQTEYEHLEADVLSCVVPIKDDRGLTSTSAYTGDLWQPRRLTLKEVHDLPETFNTEDLWHHGLADSLLLVNTGLWICRLDRPWVDSICFDVQSRIVRNPNGQRVPQCIPEDWSFSYQIHEQAPANFAKIYATRKIALTHIGDIRYPNDNAWGSWDQDRDVVPIIPIPEGYQLDNNDPGTLVPIDDPGMSPVGQYQSN